MGGTGISNLVREWDAPASLDLAPDLLDSHAIVVRSVYIIIGVSTGGGIVKAEEGASGEAGQEKIVLW